MYMSLQSYEKSASSIMRDKTKKSPPMNTLKPVLFLFSFFTAIVYFAFKGAVTTCDFIGALAIRGFNEAVTICGFTEVSAFIPCGR